MCSQFNSWVAEAMGVKFFAQGNNSIAESPDWASHREPYDYQADALALARVFMCWLLI